MIIEEVHIKNFRSILDEKIECDSLTALVGANGSGKSSVLRALDIFYSPTPKFEMDDFYNGDTSNEIAIVITYKELSEEAKELFSKYIKDNRLSIELVCKFEEGRFSIKYHGSTLQHPNFNEIREGLLIRDRGRTAKAAYENIRSEANYNSLPAWSTLGDVEPNLCKWEENNPTECERRRDDGQFFGFKEVAKGYLGRFTRFLFIPAVKEASHESIEGRGSVLTELMDLVVRSVLANKDEVRKLKEDTQRQYQEIMDPSKLSELKTLAGHMTDTLKTFVPDAAISLEWKELSEVDIPLPKADMRLIEDGYLSTVVRTGHGLQRAFILTIFQHLALVAAKQDAEHLLPDAKLPNLVLAIEEPELYQHPNRQRHLADIFLQLAKGTTPGVADKTQILYGTHSPLFVGIDRINQIRLLRKIHNGAGMPKITKVIRTDLDKVAEIIWAADGSKGTQYTGATLMPRLQAIMTPWMNEGFFSDVAVLVEGEDDRAAILGVAKALGYELEGQGYSIIPCGGKTNIDKPFVIFKELGIPAYIIWDGDAGQDESEGICEKCQRPLDKKPNPFDNRRLLRLLGNEEVDWPEYIEDSFTCFKQDMETTLMTDIGKEQFEELLSECQAEFGIRKRKQALKNPNVIKAIVSKVIESGRDVPTLRQVIDKVISLKK